MALTRSNRPPAIAASPLLRGRLPVFVLLVGLWSAVPLAHAQLPVKGLDASSSETQTATPLETDPTPGFAQVQESIRQKLQETRIRLQEINAALAATSPPSYASFDELKERKIKLFSTTLVLESWLDALDNHQKAQQAWQDLTSKVQSWSGFGFEPPYPLSLADQLAAEISSKLLELQAEQARKNLEEEQVPGFRKALELTGPKVRNAAETLEAARGNNEVRLRWLLTAAQDEQVFAEAQLQAALARVELNQARVSLLDREIDFLEEQLKQTLGKTKFPREDLEARLKTIAAQREQLQKRLAEAERQNNFAQEQVMQARASLEKDLAAEGRGQKHYRPLFELHQIEAETTSQRVETLKLLLAANNLETIFWEERFQVYEGLKKNQDLTVNIRKLDTWKKRIGEFKDYFNSKAMFIRNQIQSQNDILNNWAEQQPGRQIELAKRDAYQVRMNELEQLIAATDTLDFLISRLRVETSAEKASRSFAERLKVRKSKFFHNIGAIWNYEIFSVEDTIIADGQVIGGRRPVTLKKVVYGLLLLTLGIWAVGRASKVLSFIAQRRLKTDQSVILLFEKTGHFVAVLTVIVVALGMVQIPITAFAFLGGALAIGVGFGGQNLISNFMSSLILLIEKPIKVGDVVEAEGVLGRVTAIGGRCSTIRRFDGVDLLVPNSHLLEKTLVNRTLSDKLVRYDLKVGVAYGSSTREVFRILEQVVQEHGLVLKDPKPVVLLEDFAADALLFGVYYWVEVNERLDVRVIASDLRHRIDRLFRDAGISIAFPQRDVHLDAAQALKIQLVAEPEAKGDPAKANQSPAPQETPTLPG